MNKKHMKKRLLIFAAAILMIITTVTVHYKTEVRSEAAGIKTQQETKKKIIGATLASSQASYQYAIGNLLVAEAEKDPDYKLEIQYAEWNVKKQEEQMRDFIRRKVDAIIFCPVNAKSYLNVLREAKNAGIPVINLNMKVDTVSAEYITTYVGASMSEEADLAGQLVVECLNGKKGKVGIIEGSQGTDPQIYRTQTFLEYLSSYPDVEVVGIEEANWSRAKAGLAASRLLSQNPDINYIGFEMYDSVLLRALQKMEERAENGNTLPNVFFVRMDARELPLIFDVGEVDKIYLNFSDPWPKERHAKRRLTSRQFLERYDAILKPDGVIEFKTDNRPLFDFSLEEVNESKWHLVEWTYDLHHNEKMNVGNIMTEYEEKFSSEGNPICKLIAAR